MRKPAVRLFFAFVLRECGFLLRQLIFLQKKCYDKFVNAVFKFIQDG